MLQRHYLQREASAAVAFKDLLLAGTFITGVANMFLPRQKRLRMLNRAFVIGAIAATPVINFALFHDYRPHPVRDFVKLW